MQFLSVRDDQDILSKLYINTDLIYDGRSAHGSQHYHYIRSFEISHRSSLNRTILYEDLHGPIQQQDNS